MNTRSVIILLIVALSLAVMVLLFEREVGREVEPSSDEYKVFKAYSVDQANWVSLVRGDLTVQLQRQGAEWQMNSPVSLRISPFVLTSYKPLAHLTAFRKI